MKHYRLIISILFTAIIVFGALLLLYVNSFFNDFDSQTFNEVTTPIVTILAVMIYLYTLLEIRKQSKITNNNFQFDLFKEKIEKIKMKLENWKFNIHPIGELKQFEDIISETNGLTYYTLYNKLFEKVINSEEYFSDLQNGIAINRLDKREYARLIFTLNSMNFQSSLNNSITERLLREINESELADFQKETLNELIISDLLNDYMMIFYDYHKPKTNGIEIQGKWVTFSYNEILFKEALTSPNAIIDKELGLKSTLKVAGFDRLSKYIFDNKIWS